MSHLWLRKIGIDGSQAQHAFCFLSERGGVIARLTIAHAARGFPQIDAVRQKLGVASTGCWVGLETADTLLLKCLALTVEGVLTSLLAIPFAVRLLVGAWVPASAIFVLVPGLISTCSSIRAQRTWCLNHYGLTWRDLLCFRYT